MFLLSRGTVLLVLFGTSCVGADVPSQAEKSPGLMHPSSMPSREVPLFDSASAPDGFPQMVRCGEAVVSPDELDAPPSRGEQRDATAALREAHRNRSTQNASKKDWRVLEHTDRRLILATGEPPQLLQVTLGRRDGRWDVLGRGGCTVEAHWGETGRAEWKLNPRFPASASDTELHLLIVDQECSSGIDPRPRLETPQIIYGEETVTIALFVRPPSPKGFYTCIGPPPVPIIVELDQPIGERELLDGAVYPPQRPTLS